jgi:hypothetical protein
VEQHHRSGGRAATPVTKPWSSIVYAGLFMPILCGGWRWRSKIESEK